MVADGWVSDPQTDAQKEYCEAESVYRQFVYDNYTNVSHVDSIVTGGYYYRAGVNIYVENGGSDSRFITTDPIFVKAS